MRANAFYASTHPCWANGKYLCDCGKEFIKKRDFNWHIIKKHTLKEAEDLMSRKDYIASLIFRRKTPNNTD